MSMAVIFVMLGATAITWPINHFILEAFDLAYLQTLTFILVIAALVQVVETIMKKSMPPLYNALGIYLPLITTNCAILGLALINVEAQHGFSMSLTNAFGTGLGYALAMFIFSSIRHCKCQSIATFSIDLRPEFFPMDINCIGNLLDGIVHPIL